MEIPARNPALTLENLPAELRERILFDIPDLSALRSLVKASPVMHAQYRNNRARILRACLEAELDGFYVDVYACHSSRGLKPFATNDDVEDFLDGYRACLLVPIPAVVDLRPLQMMARYHLLVARPFAQMYTTWALSNLAQAAAASGGQGTTLSRSENVRLFRAIYRNETYHNLFGHNHRGELYQQFGDYQISHIFFKSFDPWDIEAIGCVDLFVRHWYDGIFDKVRSQGILNLDHGYQGRI